MRCTKCGTESTTGKKFCPRCGSPLISRCAKCGAENAPSSAFCEDCGAALAGNAASAATGSPQVASTTSEIRVTEQQDPSTTIDGERKTVTALFADIKGSTEWMEDLDPEEARAIIDPALKRMIDAVHRYDGYVVQSTGDGIFALFGAPVAHEDHPQRALYAALRMQEESRRYGAQLQAEGRAPIEIRVGVNTGEVVVRSIATGVAQVEYTPIGHSTNLASRLQSIARTGSIVASETTRKFCEGYFILKPLGLARVKGVSEPLNVYEVTGLGPLRTRLQRSAGRGLTKFVGREREVDALRHAAEQARGGHGQIVAAMAEPGVGKSRLYFEFKATSRAGWMVLETVSVSHGKASAYLPVIDLLRNYFDFSVGDDERKRREKVTGRVVALDRTLEDTLPYLFSLLGIVEGDDPLRQMDGQIKKRRTLDAIKRILLRESLNQPLMVEFEDLHWIDEQTQELLNLLADSIGTAKILLLVNYRPEYSQQWNSKTYYTQLRLDPLGQESAEEMLAALLGDGKDLIPLKRLIIERTEGTPFFMEEIVQVLFEDGVLQHNGTVKLVRSLNAVKVPATVQAVLAARIDRLPPEEKELLQTVAVLGREFPLGLVKRMTSRSDDDLELGLSHLQAGEFLYEQPATGDVEYIFKHALTQEVAYNSLLFERRKLLHQRAGRALESMFAEQLEEHVTQLAHHYSHSADSKKALHYLQRAAQYAVQRSANAEAIVHLEAALALVETLSDSAERLREEVTLQFALTVPMLITEGPGSSQAEKAYKRARELCEQIEDPGRLAPVLWGLFLMYLFRAEHTTAMEVAEELRRLGENANDSRILLWGHYAMGSSSCWLGELKATLHHLQQSLAQYDWDDRRSYTLEYGQDPGIGCPSIEALVTWISGYPDQALRKTRETFTLARELSHPWSIGYAGYFAAWVHQLCGEVATSQELAETVIAVCTENGIPTWLTFATAINGGALVAQGRAQEGIRQIHEGIQASRSLGSVVVTQSYLLGLLAEGHLAAGEVDQGLTVLAEALDMLAKTQECFYEAELYRLKGELTLQSQGHSPRVTVQDEAEECFYRAIEIARRQQAKSWELRATTSLARLLDSQGHREEACTILTDIYNWFTEGFDTADLKDAKALLDELGR